MRGGGEGNRRSYQQQRQYRDVGEQFGRDEARGGGEGDQWGARNATDRPPRGGGGPRNATDRPPRGAGGRNRGRGGGRRVAADGQGDGMHEDQDAAGGPNAPKPQRSGSNQRARQRSNRGGGGAPGNQDRSGDSHQQSPASTAANGTEGGATATATS